MGFNESILGGLGMLSLNPPDRINPLRDTMITPCAGVVAVALSWDRSLRALIAQQCHVLVFGQLSLLLKAV